MWKRLLAELFGRKHKIPLSFGTISQTELKKLLPMKKPNSNTIYLSHPNMHLVDFNYKLPTKQNIQDFLNKDNIDFQKFRDEVNDCDNFAVQLSGRLNEAFPGFAIGFAASDVHAFNIFVDNNKQVWFIEPQTDKIFKPNSNKRYELRMVLI